MRLCMVRPVAGIVAIAVLAATSWAGEVTELEPQGVPNNNTIATALEIPDSTFTTTDDPTVYGGSGSIGNVAGLRTATIRGRAGLGVNLPPPYNNDVDFFRFTAGGMTWLDVDIDIGPMGVALYDASGTLIAYSVSSDTQPIPNSNINSPDPGSGGQFSMGFLGAIRLAPGTYYAAVYPGFNNAPTQIRTAAGAERPTMPVHNNPQTPFTDRGLRMDPSVPGSGGFVVQTSASNFDTYLLHITTHGEAVDGLLGEWLAEGNAADTTGVHPGTLQNGASFGAGVVGQAFLLDGVDDRVLVPDSLALRLTQYTVMAWLRLDGDQAPAGLVGVVTKSDSGAPGAAVHFADYAISILGADAGGDARRIRAGYEHPTPRNDGTGLSNAVGHYVLSQAPAALGEFVHVALTYDGDDVRLYVDGVLDGQLKTWFNPNQSGSAVVIGGYDTRSGPPVQRFPGSIDQVRIYNRPLSAAEIAGFHATDDPAPQAAIAPLADIVQECDDGADGATVNFVLGVTPGKADLLRVRDETGDRTLLVSDPDSANYGVGPVTFPHGASTVSVALIAEGAAIASATFTVQIEDTIAPVLEGIEAKTMELQGPLTTLFRSVLGITVTDACDPSPTVGLAPEAVGLGTTTVTATARDESGNTTVRTFDVTVEDTMPPLFLVVPEDMERACVSGGTLVSFDVLATDLSGSAEVACEDENGDPVDRSGTRFEVGEHTITCIATDANGNTATASFHVTILDDDAPVLVCPEDIAVGTEAGEDHAFVEFTVTATDECDPDAGILCEAPWGPVESGDAFPMGTTTVVCTALDHSGNLATGSFNVTVQDREPPVPVGPAEVTLVTDCAGTPLTVSASTLGAGATDNVDSNVAIVAAPATVGPGTTEVVLTASDDDGNESQRVVQVTVLRGPFTVRFLQPLDNNVDNLIKAGRTVPVKVRVSCDNVVDTGVTARIDRVERIDGFGTPIASEVAEDSGASDDDGETMRLADDFYLCNLSTAGWQTTSGARFRVVVRITEAGHVDTLAEVILKNK